MEGGYNYDAEEFMEGDNYDVEGIFPEEFRKYVRDQKLFCRKYVRDLNLSPEDYSTNSCWFFRNKHESDEADGDIKDRFASLVNTYITGTGQCLVQFWRAQDVTSIGDFGERRFRLTSRNQPFIFMKSNDKTLFSEGICSYRMKMVDFITGDGGGDGVIGRVFRNKRMESTPNIGYYSYEEHSHRDLAQSCHIKSSLAIPLSDSSGRSVAVVEIVSSVESNLVAQYGFHRTMDFLGYQHCCKDIREQYDSLKMAVSEIEEVMQLVGRSCCLVWAQTWMLCNHCGCLSTCERLDDDLGGFYKQGYFEYDAWSDLLTLKMGEGVVGKAATSSHNLVYCDDVSQFSRTEYPLAHFARYHKLTACFATCLQSNRTGNRIYVLEFFLNPSKVNGRGPRAMLVPILEGMRKNFQTFKLASGEEIGDNLSVQVIDARFPDNFEILEIGQLDSVENCTIEMENVVNTIEGGVAIASLDKQGGELPVDVADAIFLQQPVHIDGLAIDSGENMGSNIDEQRVAIASFENQHNNATISSDERGGELTIGVINNDISHIANIANMDSNIDVGPFSEFSFELAENIGSNIGEGPFGEDSFGIAPWEIQHNNTTISSIGSNQYWNGIDVSLEEVSVSVSTFKRVCRDYQISSGPLPKKNLDQSRFDNSAQISSTKKLGGSAFTVQSESLVTIKAKYGDNFIKFKLSASSGINVFNQQVSKRLELEAGSYVVKYQDDDNDWILVRCDDDLRDYISNSASLGKTTLTMLLEHI